MPKRLLWLAIGWTALVAFLCLATFQDLPDVEIGFSGADKIVHGFLHLIFTISWSLYFSVSGFRRPVIKAMLLSLFYGVAIEFVQSVFTTTRHADFTDVIANTGGSLIAAAVLITFKKARRE